MTYPFINNGEFTVKDIRFLDYQNDQLYTLAADPWIEIELHDSTHFISVNIEMIELYKGDFFSIFYSENGRDYSEEKKVNIQLSDSKWTKKVIEFDNLVKYLRIDPSEFITGPIGVNHIKIQTFLTRENAFESLLPAPRSNSTSKLLIGTHELSFTGAPMLAHDIAQQLIKNNYDVIVIATSHSGDALYNTYLQDEIPLLELQSYVRANSRGSDLYNCNNDCIVFLQFLFSRGYSTAILNSIVCSRYAREFKAAGMKVISLIHETGLTIRFNAIFDFVVNTAMFSDYIVFPTTSVRDDFSSFVSTVKGKMLVRPQGFVLKEQSISENNNKPINSFTILGSGLIVFRKGYDLFVSSASILNELLKDTDISCNYIWCGDFADPMLKEQFVDQIEKTSLSSCFKQIDFLPREEYHALLRSANAYWSTARNDTYPSAVIEALAYNIPTFGFHGSGGNDDMLADDRGHLIKDFSPYLLAKATKELFLKSSNNSFVNTSKWVAETLSFPRYVEWLASLAASPQIISADNMKGFYSLDNAPEHVKQGKTPSENYSIRHIKHLSLVRSRRSKAKHIDSYCLIDTAAHSDNIGDQIIMEACSKEVSTLLGQPANTIPSHIYTSDLDNLNNKLSIVCGTNLLYTSMEDSRQWAFPNKLDSFNNLCFLGVGLNDYKIEEPFSPFTEELLRYLFNNKYIHSVRDSYTEARLRKIGIENVITTGCPTMWDLTEDFCSKIPKKKSKNVITTITDYLSDYQQDAYLLNTLHSEYDNVYIWLQGQFDFENIIQKIVDPTAFNFIGPSLRDFDEALTSSDIEYVGTRLHAGIRALNMGKRSFVIAIDNRARHISEDTNLPIIDRSNLQNELLETIHSEYETKIHIDFDAIDKWKKQFS